MARYSQPKSRNKHQLKRGGIKKPLRLHILIVCEGTKTEPSYFKEIWSDIRLHSAKVQVLPSTRGTSPLQVVEHAEDLFINGIPQKNIDVKSFDKVYAVFDRDHHDRFFEAWEKANSLNNKYRNHKRKRTPFIAVPSNPCFELWLLLHFEEVHSWLDCNAVIEKLKTYYPTYQKSSDDIFSTTRSHLEDAHRRAKRINDESDNKDSDTLFTYVGELVCYLKSLNN